MSIKESNGIIEQTTFLNNYAVLYSKNVFVSFSNLQIKKSNFKFTNEANPLSKVNNEETLGSFFFISLGVEISIDGSTFLNGISESGGAIYISGLSSLYLSNS